MIYSMVGGQTKAEREEEERQAKAATNIQRIARGKHERRKRVAKKQQRKEQDQECPISSKVDLHGWPLTWIPVTQAAAKIQAIQRKKKDKARVEAIHKFNLVWLRELFFKLAGELSPDRRSELVLFARVVPLSVLPRSHSQRLVLLTIRDDAMTRAGSKKAEAMVLAKLVDFFRGDQQAKDALNLPLRMFTMAPAKFQGMFKKLVWPSLEQELSGNPDKAVGWYEFAEMFRISQEEADKADVELAAVRIQAMSRQRKDSQRVKTLQRERQRLEGVEVRDDMTLGYTEDNQAIEGTGGV